MGNMWTIVMWVVIFGAFIYFLMIRPNKKRMDDQRQLMDSIKPGMRVMLASGIFGTVEEMGDQQAVVELAPGMAVTVVKQAIAKVLSDAEEEFEYTDDDAAEVEGAAATPALTGGDGTAEAAGMDDEKADASGEPGEIGETSSDAPDFTESEPAGETKK